MMNRSLKSLYNVRSGTIIEGKWHHNRYTVIRELGYGANGIVYLAHFRNQKVALKMSHNGLSILSEVNVLKSFAKVQGSVLGPSLIDVDDWIQHNQLISFYVMEYIEGLGMLSFIQQKGKTWIEILILQLLSDLQELHDKGWVFGDLKPENLMVMGPTPKIRCIDVGGTTLQGRAIKEFTDFFDRGYWGLGTRKADPTYDLFAVGMILINTEYPNRFKKTTGGVFELHEKIKQKKSLLKFETLLLNALQGNYQTANEMRAAMIQLMKAQTKAKPHRQNTTSQRSVPPPSLMNRQTYRKTRKKSHWVETVILIMVISILYMLYVYGQTT